MSILFGEDDHRRWTSPSNPLASPRYTTIPTSAYPDVVVAAKLVDVATADDHPDAAAKPAVDDSTVDDHPVAVAIPPSVAVVSTDDVTNDDRGFYSPKSGDKIGRNAPHIQVFAGL